MRSCHFFQRLVGVRGNGRLVYLFALSACYAINNICGGTCKAIDNFNRSLGSCYFVRIGNGRTSVASFARAFKSTLLIIRFKYTSKRFFLFNCHFGVT